MPTAIGGLSSLASYGSEHDEEVDDTNGLAARRTEDDSSPQNGSIGYGGSRSVSTLWSWLKEHDIQFSNGVTVADTSDAGWTLRASEDLPDNHVLCKIPKTAILSIRTTSLVLPTSTPGYEPRSTHSVWFLALALLHEIRLGAASTYYGYIQSLPRETICLPMFWGRYELCGEDGRMALEMLNGTDAARDLAKQRLEGKSVEDLERFYDLYSNLLPPTKLYPRSSPFRDYLYAYSLVSTRAFVIDVYHTLALCPFADILNHSHAAHTSLSSDDFVCHICGSLRKCPHDRPSTSGVPQRLAELSPEAIRKLEMEEDTVDLSVEVEEIKAGQEIFNSYGADLSSSQLLREWGYLDRGDRGYITFDLGGGEEVYKVWAGGLSSLATDDPWAFPKSSHLAPIPSDDPCRIGIHRSSSRITPGMWCQIYIGVALSNPVGSGESAQMQAFGHSLSLDYLVALEPEEQTPESLSSARHAARLAVRKVVSVLENRLSSVPSDLLPIGPLSQLAYEYSQAERDELQGVVEHWQNLAHTLRGSDP